MNRYRGTVVVGVYGHAYLFTRHPGRTHQVPRRKYLVRLSTETSPSLVDESSMSVESGK